MITPISPVPDLQAPKAPKKEFINYIHNFRGLAIFFVVACHLIIQWPEHSFMNVFMQVLWGNGTVLFVFIAGYLFQHLSKNFGYKGYLVKKLQYVILPYLIVSIPIIIYRLKSNDYSDYILGPHPDFASWPVWERLCYFLLRGAHMKPLWFVPMISLFYLSAPVFIYIDRHPKLYYLLIVFCTISVFVVREPLSDIPRMFVHFFSVYVFGMFMSHYKQRYLEFAKKYYILISILTLLAFAADLVFFEQLNNSLNYLHKMLFCCFFLYWFWRLDRYVPAFLSLLAELSFGLFFIHYYTLLAIKAVYEKKAGHPIPGNFVSWAIDLLLVLIGSILIIKFIKKIFPRYSRYLIGC
jgi:peptidoglycan/LPS O-acetylase OafA/YrhL